MELLLILSLCLNVVVLYYLIFWKKDDEVAEKIDKLGELDEVDKKGRVTKVTAPPEYDPELPTKKGGHVVRRMPKQLKAMKDAQETKNE